MTAFAADDVILTPGTLLAARHARRFGYSLAGVPVTTLTRFGQMLFLHARNCKERSH